MATRSLLDKMGFKPGMRARVVGLPEELGPILQVALASGDQAVTHPPDWFAAFVTEPSDAAQAAADIVPLYRRGQHLWFCYLKGRHARPDMNRDRGWDALSALGLLPVTAVSVDAQWSALRFRYRDEIKTITRRF